jgi:hypothetical protein
VRRSVATIAVLLAGATALVGPAVAEWSALRALRAGVARCPGQPAGAWWGMEGARPGAAKVVCGGLARADVDLDGLRLWQPWREQAGVRVEADEVSVTVDRTGVRVDARALRLGKAVSTKAADPSASEPRPAEDPPAARAPRSDRPRLHTRGVPVHVRVHGQATWSQAGAELTVGEPELHLDGHGNAAVSLTLALAGLGVQARGVDRWTAETVDGDPRRWRAQGAIELADGPVAMVALTVSRAAVQARLQDPDGGQLVLAAALPEDGYLPEAIDVRAERFAMSTLGRLGQTTLQRWGLNIDDARIDGALEVEGLRTPEVYEHIGAAKHARAAKHGSSEGDGISAQIERLVIDGLVVDHRKLARAPVELDTLELHGELSWRDSTAAGTLWVAHRDVRLSLTAQLGPEAFDLRTELAPLPCQALLDAFPTAMSEMVAGTRLAGELQGRAELHLDRVALARARAQGDGDRDDEPPVPGSLLFAFPFLERCTVVADDPRLDLAALSGPYRHRFVDDDGRERQRVMAPGAPGYVSIEQVPLLVRAFVGLEDFRFWEHDGFDREQIEGAFWHNLVQGRVSRGASTVSQQAARNLWLGVDRSWGRKLQEALLTARLEASTDKARIMELYLNVIELGPGAHGVDEAAQLYFGKPAARLSVLQAIHLAALAPAPRRFAARFVDGHVDAQWLDMLRAHVRRMNRAGLLGDGQMYVALRDELQLLDRR